VLTLVAEYVVPVKLVEHGTDSAAVATAVGTVLLAVAAIATLIVVIKTASTAVESLNDAKKTRHGQLVTDLSRRWDEPLMVDSIKLFSEHAAGGTRALIARLYRPHPTKGRFKIARSKRRQAADIDLFYRISAWPNLIETIGVLYATKMIEGDVVYKMWGPGIVAAWEAWKAPVQQIRDLSGRQDTFRYFQELAKDMAAAESVELERESRLRQPPSAQAVQSPQAEAAEPDDKNG
jgi:hypothetical protein